MKKHAHITAFYLETLLLIIVFIGIILVLTRVSGICRSMSTDAELLSNAVCLAQNAAEAVSASDSPDTLAALLDEGGNVHASGSGVEALYEKNMTPDQDGDAPLRVLITWEPSLEDSRFIRSAISVYSRNRDRPVYELATAVYLEGVSP